MKATKTGMAGYTRDELLAYLERTNIKYHNAPAFIRRTSFVGWANDQAAIVREILKRKEVA